MNIDPPDSQKGQIGTVEFSIKTVVKTQGIVPSIEDLFFSPEIDEEAKGNAGEPMAFMFRHGNMRGLKGFDADIPILKTDARNHGKDAFFRDSLLRYLDGHVFGAKKGWPGWLS